MPNNKPLDTKLAGIKSENSGSATVTSWLKRRADKRADAFPESEKKPNDAAKRR
jgi:hypothetical protein